MFRKTAQVVRSLHPGCPHLQSVSGIPSLPRTEADSILSYPSPRTDNLDVRTYCLDLLPRAFSFISTFLPSETCPSLSEQFQDCLVKCRNAVRLPAADPIPIDHSLFVAPLCFGIPQIIFEHVGFLDVIKFRDGSALRRCWNQRPSGNLRSSKGLPDVECFCARDAAYHQGTVWPWLIGAYIDAWLKVHPDKVDEARSLLSAFKETRENTAVGSIAEITDADAPYTARGCVGQAWSVAEVLRSLVKLATMKDSEESRNPHQESNIQSR